MSAFYPLKIALFMVGIVYYNVALSQEPTVEQLSSVRTWILKRPITDENMVPQTTVSEATQTTQYLDGLGRPVQTVTKAITPLGKDLVAPVEYDNYGREQIKRLPYASATSNGQFHTDPITEQKSFYGDANTSSPIFGQGEDPFYYSQTIFENSPLNRITEVRAPGSSWVGNSIGIKTQYLTNTTADDVKVWVVTNSSTAGGFGSYSLSTVQPKYDMGTLYKTITTYENGKQTIEFKDKEDKVILKKVQLTSESDGGAGKNHTGWLCTYYIYDDLDNLRCVIQPAGVEVVKALWRLNETDDVRILAELCFRYEYDGQRRMIMKKVPGSAVVNMVYDARDRLIMSQDGSQKAAGKWLVTHYDALNRPIITGLLTDPSTSIATHRDNAKASITYPDVSGSNFELLTQTYYDNYTWLPSSGPFTNAVSSGGFVYGHFSTGFLTASDISFPYPQAKPVSPQKTNIGLVTGSKLKILDTDPPEYLYSAIYYDDKERVCQTKSTNITGGIDISSNQYSFDGKLLANKLTHNYAQGPLQSCSVVTRNNYDAAGRLTSIYKTVNNTAIKTTVSHTYDELGQLKLKKLAPAYNSGNGLSNLTHDYNIHGWLLGVNRNEVLTSNIPSSRKFGYELGYDKLTNKTGRNFIAPQLNGNINGVVWKSSTDGIRRKYDFSYDAANRLMQAVFEQNNSPGASWDNLQVNYTVKMGDGVNPISAYDNNGNIKRMQQKGLKITGPEQIDDLIYNYFANTNKVREVKEQSNGNIDHGLGDFTDKNTNTSEYGYDVNGNLVTDLNKRLMGNASLDVTSPGAVTYNFLNLPKLITVKKDIGTATKGTITYTYDAAGNKLKKTIEDVSVSGKTITTVTNYIGPFVYESKTTDPAEANDYANVLQFASHEEGRIRYKPANNTVTPAIPASYSFDYFIKDHLGNVRMVLTEEQQEDIYPAATLEGVITAGGTPNAIFTEKDFYSINTSNVVDKPAAMPASINKNGGALANDVPINNNPNSNTTAASQKVYQLEAASTAAATGLGITLKVMAGDRINVFGKSYWKDNNTTQGNSNVILADILAAMLGTPGTATSGKGATATNLTEGSNPTALPATFLTRNPVTDDQKPMAYINWILLDDQFKYHSSGFSRVGDANAIKDHFSELQNIPVVKSGYLYVYCSNQSPVKVFFDNLQVIHTRGPILEETHYYPFGLTMAGISSKAAGKLDNKYQLFGKELQHNEFADGGGLEWYDYGMREYDQQTGRFFRVDPITEKFYELSPYQYCSNDPIKNVDLDGAEGLDFRIFAKLVANTAQNPNGTSAKVLGAATGVGGAVTGAVTGAVNTGLHPIQTLQGLGHMLSQSPVQNGIEYGVNVASQYVGSGSDAFTNYAVGAHALTDIAMVLSPMKGAFASKSASVWKMAVSPRGFAVEAQRIAALGEAGRLPAGFNVLDHFTNGVATSIKSIDLTAPSYSKGNSVFNTLKRYIDKLNNFTYGSKEGVTITNADITTKVLDVSIQPGKATLSQWEQIGNSMKYAKGNGIQFNLQFIK